MKKPSSFKIATLASHTALPILWGAKQQQVETILISTPEKQSLYSRYDFFDHVVILDSFQDLLTSSVQQELLDLNAVLIPHGSFVALFSPDEIENLSIPIFGNKLVLRWEAELEKHTQWLKTAHVRTPLHFNSIDDIDRLVIVKFTGAKGGKGYFIASDKKIIKEKLSRIKHKSGDTWFQEYIRGVPMFFHFFKHLNGKNVLTGIDIRYESDANAFGRIPAKFQLSNDLQPNFSVVGNIPVVARESLLQRVFKVADSIQQASERLIPPGLIGPYCIESIVTPDLDIVVIEISSRIVAGTTAWHTTSPYMLFEYNEPLSIGELIAIELKKHGEKVLS